MITGLRRAQHRNAGSLFARQLRLLGSARHLAPGQSLQNGAYFIVVTGMALLSLATAAVKRLTDGHSDCTDCGVTGAREQLGQRLVSQIASSDSARELGAGNLPAAGPGHRRPPGRRPGGLLPVPAGAANPATESSAASCAPGAPSSRRRSGRRHTPVQTPDCFLVVVFVQTEGLARFSRHHSREGC